MAGEALELETKAVAKARSYAMNGRPQNSTSAKRQIEIARHHGRRALLVAIRRLKTYLADPSTKVDQTYLNAFKELASRCGLPAQTSQTVEATSVTATITPEGIEAMAQRLIQDVIISEAAE